MESGYFNYVEGSVKVIVEMRSRLRGSSTILCLLPRSI